MFRCVEFSHFDMYLACLPYNVMLFFDMIRAGGRGWVGFVTNIWCLWHLDFSKCEILIAKLDSRKNTAIIY